MRAIIDHRAALQRAVAADCYGPRPCVDINAEAVTGVPTKTL